MKKLNNEDIIKRLKIIYSDEYDYSLIDYTGYNNKIKIICKKHGIFEQTPKILLCLKNGCPKCNMKVLSVSELIDRFNNIHNNKYNYTNFLSFKNNKDKIRIICPEHGEFYQKIVDHLKFGCKKCSRKFMDLQLFINTANKIHNNKYDYSLIDYRNNHTKVKIICKKHGIFEQRPNDHLMKRGCPHCNESQGELKIAEYLDNNSILYERQKTFIDCKNIKKLPFDFFLPDFNICIEYDGIQHFKSIKRWGGDISFLNRIKIDKIKTNYCKDNNLKLIRIRYDEEDFINKIKSHIF